MTYSYLVHGLSVASDIEFPELAKFGGSSVDVRIAVHQFADAGAAVDDNLSELSASFTVNGVAQFDVLDGAVIDIYPAPGADQRDVRLFALGSAMGLLLHQRGLLAFHASAVVIDGKAVAITGPSGAGKSTMALALHEGGYPILSDDLVVIECSGSSPVAHRAVRRMRLAPDSLAVFGRSSADFPISYRAADDRIKYDVPFDEAVETAPLIAIVELADGPMRLEQLMGSDAVGCIMANSYRGTMLTGAAQRSRHFQSCMDIAKQVRVFRLHRPKDFSGLDDQIELLIGLSGHQG